MIENTDSDLHAPDQSALRKSAAICVLLSTNMKTFY